MRTWTRTQAIACLASGDDHAIIAAMGHPDTLASRSDPLLYLVANLALRDVRAFSRSDDASVAAAEKVIAAEKSLVEALSSGALTQRRNGGFTPKDVRALAGVRRPRGRPVGAFYDARTVDALAKLMLTTAGGDRWDLYVAASPSGATVRDHVASHNHIDKLWPHAFAYAERWLARVEDNKEVAALCDVSPTKLIEYRRNLDLWRPKTENGEEKAL